MLETYECAAYMVGAGDVILFAGDPRRVDRVVIPAGRDRATRLRGMKIVIHFTNGEALTTESHRTVTKVLGEEI